VEKGELAGHACYWSLLDSWTIKALQRCCENNSVNYKTNENKWLLTPTTLVAESILKEVYHIMCDCDSS